MKSSRYTIVATLLMALLLASCGLSARLAKEIAPGEADSTELAQDLGYPPFQDFPQDANPQQAQPGKGNVEPTKVENSLFQAKFEGDAVSGSGGAVGGKYHFIATETDGES